MKVLTTGFGAALGVAACALGFLSAQALPQTAPPQTPPPQTTIPQATPGAAARAEAVVDALVARDFAKVVAQFNAIVKAALPEEKLRAGWDGVLAQAGAFVRRTGSRVEARGGVTAVVVTCEFERAKTEMFVVFDAAGEIGTLQIRPVQAAAPYMAPDYAVGAAYTEREVSVGGGEWIVPGTLTMPTGAGPFPAVVFVHGSGPNDRDETFGPNRMFKDLALGLASRGVASLRYDKRTKVHAARLAALKQFTVKEEAIDDTLAAVAMLRREPSIDARRVYVLGHSLGGMLAPRIAVADPALAGVIVMAGGVRSLDQSIVDQVRYLAESDGTITEAEQRALDGAQKTRETVAALTPADAASGRMISGAPASYWLDLRGYDPPALAATLKMRMLVLQGARDYQVTVADFERWKAALAKRPDVEFRLYPALNHLFLAGQGRSLPAEYSVPGHVPVEVISDIVVWISPGARLR